MILMLRDLEDNEVLVNLNTVAYIGKHGDNPTGSRIYFNAVSHDILILDVIDSLVKINMMIAKNNG